MFSSPVLAIIIVCEVGFWVLVGGGLALRYLVGKPGASIAVLWLVPLLDVILLIAVGIDLYNGADVKTVHMIAGLYLGASVAFGPSMIRWTDARFAYYFANGPKPAKAPKTGVAAVAHEWRSFVLWLIAAIITLVVVFVLTITVADNQQRSDLYQVLPILGLITALWFVSGPAWAVGQQLTDKLRK